MTVVSLAVLLTGLVLGVFSMLYGTERPVQPAAAPHERRSSHDPAAEPSALFNAASLAALAVGFGLTGYLLDRFTTWGWGALLTVALLAGAAAYAGQALLMARWAIPSARREGVDERFLLQGTPGRVEQGAASGAAGVMRYALDGREHALPVRALDGTDLASGTDVVIDRVEDGVAIVERWDDVERRL